MYKHVIRELNGSDSANAEMIIIGKFFNQTVPVNSNGIESVNVTSVGSYPVGGAFPTVTANAPGSGAALSPRMQINTYTVPYSMAGFGYKNDDVNNLSSINFQVTATCIAAGALSVNAGGSGYAVGDQITLTAVGGSGTTTAPVLTVTTISSGAVTGFNITNPGVFGGTNNPTSFTQASTTGSGTGATFSIPARGFGVAAGILTNNLLLSSYPGDTFYQTYSSGSGNGMALKVLTWSMNSVLVTKPGSGYSSSTTFTLSPTGAGITSAVLGAPTIDADTAYVPITYTFKNGLPMKKTGKPGYAVFIQSNLALSYTVTNQTATNFTVTFTPPSGGSVVGGTYNMMIFG